MKYITIGFAIFLLAVIVGADRGSLPAPLKAVYDFPNGDKLGHFILLGIMSWLLNLTMLSSQATRNMRSVLAASSMLAVLITVEEFSQIFFRTRTFDLIDLASSYAGIAAFAFLAMRLKAVPPAI